jgi:hypothetical protein
LSGPSRRLARPDKHVRARFEREFRSAALATAGPEQPSALRPGPNEQTGCCMAAVTISCGKLVLSFEQDERQWHSNLTDGGQSWGEAAPQQPVLSKAFTRFRMPWLERRTGRSAEPRLG